MFKPLLAARESPQSFPKYWALLRFPFYVSPKLDGIRCITTSHAPMSRSWKPIPSYQVQDMLRRIEGIDGELIEGCETDGDVYNRTQSHVMSTNKPGDISFWAFDNVHPSILDCCFEQRQDALQERIAVLQLPYIKYVPQRLVHNLEEFLAAETEFLEMGFEGVIGRSPEGLYKHGRSTFREQIAFKLKREEDTEGTIVGFVERMINLNEQKRDALGYAERSSSKEGKVPAGMVGKFLVERNGEIENVASGKFCHEDLKEIWDNQEFYLGKLLKFRHFPHGAKDAPRQPRALGFRSEIDM